MEFYSTFYVSPQFWITKLKRLSNGIVLYYYFMEMCLFYLMLHILFFTHSHSDRSGTYPKFGFWKLYAVMEWTKYYHGFFFFFPQKHFSIFDYFSNGECQETENGKFFFWRKMKKNLFSIWVQSIFRIDFGCTKTQFSGNRTHYLKTC